MVNRITLELRSFGTLPSDDSHLLGAVVLNPPVPAPPGLLVVQEARDKNLNSSSSPSHDYSQVGAEAYEMMVVQTRDVVPKDV